MGYILGVQKQPLPPEQTQEVLDLLHDAMETAPAAKPAAGLRRKILDALGLIAAIAILGAALDLHPRQLEASAPVLPAAATSERAIDPPAAPATRKEELRQAALEAVQGYRPTADSSTLGEMLESSYPARRGSLPWEVQKIEDDRFEVRYYAGGRVMDRFAVWAKAGRIEGVNEAAVSLLMGELPEPLPPQIVKRHKRHSRPAQ